jgi:hypothetical protein
MSIMPSRISQFPQQDKHKRTTNTAVAHHLVATRIALSFLSFLSLGITITRSLLCG